MSQGKFIFEVLRPDGSVRLRGETTNHRTLVGVEQLLGAFPQIGSYALTTNVYVSLISDTNFTAVSVSDTMSSHAGWQEEQSYSEANRVQWNSVATVTTTTETEEDGTVVGVATATNSSYLTFTASATISVRGFFVMLGSNTKGGTTGVLFATSLFDAGALSFYTGETVKVYYRTDERTIAA